METCDACKHNKYGTIKGNSPLVDLRLVKQINTKINEPPKKGKYNIISDNLNLLKWVILQSDIVVMYKYDQVFPNYISIIQKGVGKN